MPASDNRRGDAAHVDEPDLHEPASHASAGDPPDPDADALTDDAPTDDAPADDAPHADVRADASADDAADHADADAVVTDPARAVTPDGADVAQEVTADDLDAPDVHPGAADPAAADSPSGRRNLIVVGVVVVILLALLGGLALLSGGGGGDVAYTVFDDTVTRDELAERLEGLVSDEALQTLGSEDATPEQQAEVAEAMSTLITLDILEHAAEEEGVEVTEDDVDQQVEEVVATGFDGDRQAFDSQLAQAGLTIDTVRLQFRTALLAEALVDGDVDPIDPADVQAAYDQQFDIPTVSHILVETEEEAQAALARIEDGEPFADVARDVSTDPGSADRGGELGPLQPGQFVPEFEEAALALQPGEVSDPVQTDFGFHLITVAEPPPFEEVEAQITQALTDQQLGARFTELAERLEQEAEVTVDEDFGTWTGLTRGGLVPPGQPQQPPVQPAPDQPAPDEPAGQ